MFYFLVSLFAAVPDIILKRKVEATPESDYPRPLGFGGITLHRHHNYGFCMNRLDRYPEVVRPAASFLYAFFLGIAAFRLRNTFSGKNKNISPEAFGLALILGGGGSNLFDRLRLGYVVDYFSLPFRKIRHVIMNLGDLCIFAGSFLLALSALAGGSDSDQ